MAYIIAVLNPKGGVGKSTVISNLARAFQKEDKANVLIADSDVLGTLRDWKEASSDETLPMVVGLDRPALYKDIAKIAPSFDFIIIDGAAKLQEMLACSVKTADMVVIPVQPSLADVWGCRSLISLIKARQEVTEGKPKAVFLINKHIKNTKMSQEIISVLKKFEFPLLEARVTQRVIYAEVLSGGTTVLDIEPNGEAALEVKNILKELKGYIYG